MVTVAILLLVASTGAMIGVGVSLLCQSCKKENKYSFEEVKTSTYIKELGTKVDNLSELVDTVDLDLRDHICREEERNSNLNNRFACLEFQYDSLDEQEDFRHDMILDKLECIAKIITNINELDSQKQNKISRLLAKGIDEINDELEDLSLELGENKSAICRKINELKPHMKKRKRR